MADEKQKPVQEVKQVQEQKSEAKPAETKTEAKKETKIVETKTKKDYAIVNGYDLHLSPKHAFAICNMVRNRNIDTALKMVEEVTTFRRAVMMNDRQVGHQHGKGMMAGGYPINACKEFLRLLKQLKANALHHELEIEKYILFCVPNRASEPWKSGGRKTKRCQVMLKLVLNQKAKNKPQNKNNNGGKP